MLTRHRSTATVRSFRTLRTLTVSGSLRYGSPLKCANERASPLPEPCAKISSRKE